MRLSLPAQIFVVHLLFMVLLGALGLFMIRRTFDEYRTGWENQVATFPTEKLMSPLASEVARSLLLKVQGGVAESRARDRAVIGDGLNRVLPTIPSIRRLMILDDEGQVQYVNDPSQLSLHVADDYLRDLPVDGTTIRREVESGPERDLIVEAWSILDPKNSSRLGAVVLQYDPTLAPPAGQEPNKSWTSDVALSLLAQGTGETAESFKRSVSGGLNTLLANLPIESLIIVDNQRRIQYVNDSRYLDLKFIDAEMTPIFKAGIAVRREVLLQDGEPGLEIVIPVKDQAGDGSEEEQRLGSILIRYRPDPDLIKKIPGLEVKSVSILDAAQPLLLFLAAAVAGGILLAAVTYVPVQRMESAFAEFREGGFQESGDLEKKLPSGLAQTAEAMRELGGRLQALDRKGSEREALLATLSSSLEDGMIAIDADGSPLAWNPAALRMLTGAPEEKRGGVRGRKAIAEREKERIKQALSHNPDLQFGLDRVELGPARELELVQPGGQRQVARVTQVPVEIRPGLQGYLLLIRDMATLRRVEAHLLDAGRFAVLTHLAAGLAHEIRNPLHAIHINAGVVEQYTGGLENLRGGEAIQESVAAIKDEAKRLTELLNNYLGMVRPGSEIGLLDLRETASKVIQLVNYAANRANVEIHVTGDVELPVVKGDGRRLQQAILNLVMNAIQAMSERESNAEPGRLTLDFRAIPGAVRLLVEDTGPGLPEALAEQLFETRVTTKPGGAGLGLPLVRMIVESHGGSVSYRAAEGGGACFEILLPAKVG